MRVQSLVYAGWSRGESQLGQTNKEDWRQGAGTFCPLLPTLNTEMSSRLSHSPLVTAHQGHRLLPPAPLQCPTQLFLCLVMPREPTPRTDPVAPWMIAPWTTTLDPRPLEPYLRSPHPCPHLGYPLPQDHGPLHLLDPDHWVQTLGPHRGSWPLDSLDPYPLEPHPESTQYPKSQCVSLAGWSLHLLNQLKGNVQRSTCYWQFNCDELVSLSCRRVTGGRDI